jgi:hypothetical protein
MMRLWMYSYAEPSPIARAGVLSALVHGAVIVLAVVATGAPASMPADSLANRVVYIPPPDRPPAVAGARQSLYYVTLREGPGAGPGAPIIDVGPAVSLAEHSRQRGAQNIDSTTAPAGTGDTHTDSVFTVLEVDSAVARSQSSAAPAYPLDLLAKHIEGAVVTRYVVDTTGFADIESLVVLDATHTGFATAVREALPYMRFTPAKVGTHRVRQLVEQTFSFRINPAPPDPGKPD